MAAVGPASATCLGRVLVGDDNVRAARPLRAQCRPARPARPACRRRSKLWSAGGAMALPRALTSVKKSSSLEHAGGPQRRKFAKAVPGDEIRLKAGLLEKAEQPNAGDADRRPGRARCASALFLGGRAAPASKTGTGKTTSGERLQPILDETARPSARKPGAGAESCRAISRPISRYCDPWPGKSATTLPCGGQARPGGSRCLADAPRRRPQVAS